MAEDAETLHFGILDNENPKTVFNQEIDKNPFFGFSTSFGIEVGALNMVAGGLQVTNYYYPKAVIGNAITFEGYVRFKLFTVFSKK